MMCCKRLGVRVFVKKIQHRSFVKIFERGGTRADIYQVEKRKEKNWVCSNRVTCSVEHKMLPRIQEMAR